MTTCAGADIVVIPAGVPRKPGMTRQDLFAVNAKLNQDFATAVSKNCPNAMVAIISNPVNSTVPIFAEQMKALGAFRSARRASFCVLACTPKCLMSLCLHSYPARVPWRSIDSREEDIFFGLAGTYDPKKIFGVTTLDIVRSHTFVAEAAGVDVNTISIPVVGGHAGASILPLLSQATPSVSDKLSAEQVNPSSRLTPFAPCIEPGTIAHGLYSRFCRLCVRACVWTA
jgi:malate dehydrogenase